VNIPQRIRAQYPTEMTIVLQHQFWDLGFDRDTNMIQVGLSFGGVPSKLFIPLDAVVEFADPHIRYGLRFQAAETPAADTSAAETPTAEAAPAAAPAQAEAEADPPAKDAEPAQVVSLDAFRRRQP
jgi:hypothetical protein